MQLKLYFKILLILFLLNICSLPQTNDSIHIALGIPTDSDSTDDYLIFRKQYVLSYNNNYGIPNWVSYYLDKNWFGNVKRYQGKFITDYSLPYEFNKVKHEDYTNSGYDRGHCVRSEERTKTIEDNISTFLLTNIIPQTPELNRGAWLRFESFCENLCKKENKKLFIICGGINHTKKTLLNKNKVTIPDSCYKIVVVLDSDQTTEQINIRTKIYAVCMPNAKISMKEKWEKYRTTIRRIEYSTGYNFLSNIRSILRYILEKNFSY